MPWGSSEARAALARGETPRTSVRLVNDGEGLASTESEDPDKLLGVLSGQVTLDGCRDVRAQARLTMTVPDALVPDGDTSPLSGMSGAELHIGQYLGNELVPLGVFPLTDPEITDDGNQATLVASCQDRASDLAVSFMDPHVVDENTDVAAAVEAIVQTVHPDQRTNVFSIGMDMDYTVYRAGTTKLAAVSEMGYLAGHQFHYDRAGTAQLSPLHVSTDEAVWDWQTGDAQLLAVKRALRRPPANVVRYRSESFDTGEVTEAEACDNAAFSGNYYDGENARPIVETVSQPMTEDQLLLLAQTRLAAVSGLGEQLSITISTNPMVDPGDVAAVTHERTKTNGLWIVDVVNIDLSPAAGNTTIVTRLRR